MTNEAKKYEVLVIGGGAAGLSGALVLARARRSVLVVDSGTPRNAPADGVHGYLGREGTPPAELSAIGREEVAAYGGEIVFGEAVSAERLPDGGFRVTLASGDVYTADRLLLATGVVDELPDVPGLAGQWGRDVVHCPFCHGWEARDRAIGVLGTGPLAVHQALLWTQWSDTVTLLKHELGPLSEQDERRLAARGVRIAEGRVAGLVVAEGRIAGVGLEDGGTVPVEVIAVGTTLAARTALLESLELELADLEMAGQVVARHVPVDATGRTAVAGVWAAGNVADPMAQVVIAAAAGLKAAAAITMDLVESAVEAALDDADHPDHGWHGRHRQATHGHSFSATDGLDPVADPSAFWDARYREKDRIWSGKPNVALVRETSGLAAGRALDLGSGEGADAIWLARRGWHVTAVDVSQVALDRGAAEAAREGLAELIDWQRHDLTRTFPDSEYDLVTAQYLHAPSEEFPRREILARAAAAVAPGGVLLIVGHATFPAWLENPPKVVLPLAAEVLAELDLPDDAWELLRAEEFERDAPGPDGQPGTRADNTVMFRRRVGSRV